MYKINSKLVALLFSLVFFAVNPGIAAHKKVVTVEIKSEDTILPLKIETNWMEGLSAMEALQFVAEVTTHPVGKYVFVTAINGVEGVPNKSVWYYEINGEPAKKIAIDQLLKSGDVVTWIHKKDVCSPKKDNTN